MEVTSVVADEMGEDTFKKAEEIFKTRMMSSNSTSVKEHYVSARTIAIEALAQLEYVKYIKAKDMGQVLDALDALAMEMPRWTEKLRTLYEAAVKLCEKES